MQIHICEGLKQTWKHNMHRKMKNEIDESIYMQDMLPGQLYEGMVHSSELCQPHKQRVYIGGPLFAREEMGGEKRGEERMKKEWNTESV